MWSFTRSLLLPLVNNQRKLKIPSTEKLKSEHQDGVNCLYEKKNFSFYKLQSLGNKPAYFVKLAVTRSLFQSCFSTF